MGDFWKKKVTPPGSLTSLRSHTLHSLQFRVNCTLCPLTLSWRRPLSYRNQSIDWFLYDIGLRHERVNYYAIFIFAVLMKQDIHSSLISCHYNRGQNFTNNVKKSNKKRRDEKSLISVFSLFLTITAKVLLVKGRLGTRLCLHSFLRFFQYSLIS